MARKQKGSDSDVEAVEPDEPSLTAAPAGGAAGVVRDLGAATPEAVHEVAAAATPEPAGAKPAVEPSNVPLAIAVEVVRGDIVSQSLPVVVVGQYGGMPPRGAARKIDKAMNSWIKWAIELGMVGSGLGELFSIPVTRGEIKAGAVLLAGMGEFGQFERDDLRFLMTNVVLAVVNTGHMRFGTVLIGASRDDLPVDNAVRSLLEGVCDAFERLPAKPPGALTVVVVEADLDRYRLILKALENLKALAGQADPGGTPVGFSLSIAAREDPLTPGEETDDEPTRSDLSPDVPTNQITVTDVTPAGEPKGPPVRIFEYSAMSESASIPVREVPVQPYFADRLPLRLSATTTAREQELYGLLLASYLLPDDFSRLLEGHRALTLVLDVSTARFPWEMAAVRGRRGTTFLGPDQQLTRQFRTTLSPAPGLPPPRNSSLNVLVIADPAPYPFRLPGAREEGLAVVRVLALAKAAWGARLDLQVTVRIGPTDNPGFDEIRDDLNAIEGASEVIAPDPAPCDPLEILALLLNEQFDVVHYAGHGVNDPVGRGKGWLFDDGCVLSAKEIFRVRRVPRLVFANACHSSEIGPSPSPDSTPAVQVGLAEAFFSRGIDNYIGAGWEVSDTEAVAFATRFYLQVLGVSLQPEDRIKLQRAAPPDTLGVAMAAARKALIELGGDKRGSTWGAYQHYGLVNDKLLSFVNRDAEQANDPAESGTAGPPKV